MEIVRENLYIPFCIPRTRTSGGYTRSTKPTLHMGMQDSGAMISCMTEATMRAFPAFSSRFHARPDVVRGVGGHTCRTLGEVRRVPISIGEDQQSGSIFLCTFRVTEGKGYTIIFGLNLLVPLHASIDISRRRITFSGAKDSTGARP